MTLLELMHSIEESPEVEDRLFQCESKWQGVWDKFFTDRGITDIAVPPLPKEKLKRSIIGDLFKECCRSMGIFDLVEAMVNSVINHIKYFLTLPEAQDFLKSMRKEEQQRIDEANRLTRPIRSLILKLGIEDLDSWQMAELSDPLEKIAIKTVWPPFDPLCTDTEWAESFLSTFLQEVGEQFIRERQRLLREADDGRAFSLSRSRRGLEAAIEAYVDNENRLRQRAKGPTDRLIYSHRRGGWHSKEVVKKLDLMGERMTNSQVRQRYSRLSRQMQKKE